MKFYPVIVYYTALNVTKVERGAKKMMKTSQQPPVGISLCRGFGVCVALLAGSDDQ
jgi:hypothetical protein